MGQGELRLPALGGDFLALAAFFSFIISVSMKSFLLYCLLCRYRQITWATVLRNRTNPTGYQWRC